MYLWSLAVHLLELVFRVLHAAMQLVHLRLGQQHIVSLAFISLARHFVCGVQVIVRGAKLVVPRQCSRPQQQRVEVALGL